MSFYLNHVFGGSICNSWEDKSNGLALTASHTCFPTLWPSSCEASAACTLREHYRQETVKEGKTEVSGRGRERGREGEGKEGTSLHVAA